MDRNEARKAAEVMLAYADGKEIEVRKGDRWFLSDSVTFNWFDFEYRIKPQPKYRPFKSAEECWQEMQKHQPFGWVKTEAGEYRFIDRIASAVHLADMGKSYIAFCGALENYTFADGSVFGVKEEEA